MARSACADVIEHANPGTILAQAILVQAISARSLEANLEGPRPPSQCWEQRISSDIAKAVQIRSRKRQEKKSTVPPQSGVLGARA